MTTMLAPTRKLMIADLPGFYSESTEKLAAATHAIGGTLYVWLQGNVVRKISDDEIVLNDGSGETLVTAIGVVPGLQYITISLDLYVLVIGELVMQDKEPHVRAIKIQDLSYNATLLREMWPLEVKEQRSLLHATTAY